MSEYDSSDRMSTVRVMINGHLYVVYDLKVSHSFFFFSNFFPL